jgi:hypothetical protein
MKLRNSSLQQIRRQADEQVGWRVRRQIQGLLQGLEQIWPAGIDKIHRQIRRPIEQQVRQQTVPPVHQQCRQQIESQIWQLRMEEQAKFDAEGDL